MCSTSMNLPLLNDNQKNLQHYHGPDQQQHYWNYLIYEIAQTNMSSNGTKVYVGGLVDSIKKEDLEREFDKYGKLNSVWVALNPPGFAFIEFENLQEAEDACSAMNGTEVLGATLKVELSKGQDGSRRGNNFRGGEDHISVGDGNREEGSGAGGHPYNNRMSSGSSFGGGRTSQPYGGDGHEGDGHEGAGHEGAGHEGAGNDGAGGGSRAPVSRF